MSKSLLQYASRKLFYFKVASVFLSNIMDIMQNIDFIKVAVFGYIQEYLLSMGKFGVTLADYDFMVGF